jgi:UDP:flavonoid glycosyltransferase YjiC (YdhE family)
MRVLAYTSPARGHLNPMMGPLLELKRRGAKVHVRTLAAGVPAVREAGIECEPIDPAIEEIAMDDHRASTLGGAAKRAHSVWAKRAPLDAEDFAAAIEAFRPDVALVDTLAFGAKAVAEREGFAWAESRPFLLDDPAPGAPPLGLGLRQLRGPLGRLRDAALNAATTPILEWVQLPTFNAGRTAAGLPSLTAIEQARHRAPLTLYFTAEPFEYPRPLPEGVLMVGPDTWDPPAELPIEVPDGNRPLALVTCSSEFQDDGAIAAAALEGMAGRWRLVITAAAVDPAGLPRRADAVVARFLPHRPLLERASVVVCHGGMGIAQKALAHGVPVCVVPWGRDQLDVAARVEEAGAGVRLSRRRLTPARLAAAAMAAESGAAGAARVRAGYEATGGPSAAADAVESLSSSSRPKVEDRGRGV